MVLVLTLEGGIGAGKTTVYNGLKEAFKDVQGVGFVPDPVADWEKHGLLQAMYEKTLSAAVFQSVVLMSLHADMVSALNSPDNLQVLICERSAATNNLFAVQNLEGMELQSYNFVFERLLKAIPSHVSTHHIYLRAPVKSCKERIAVRNRDGESNIEEAYLQGLHDLHEKWADEAKNVLTVDATKSEGDVIVDVFAAIQNTVDKYGVCSSGTIKLFRDRAMMLRFEAEIIQAMQRDMSKFTHHGDRVVTMALMNPALNIDASPRQVLSLVTRSKLSPGHLWTLFKSSGGRSKEDDESTPDESEQKEALQLVWRSLERAASRRAEDVRAVPVVLRRCATK